MEMKTEADADCTILEYPHDDNKPTVGMLLHSFICFSLGCFVISFICISGWLERSLAYVCICPHILFACV